MEFRCRLVTASGEIVEGTYAAENEARLRHEFENQGLHVLSLRKRGLLSGTSGFPQRRKIPRHEFLIFNQEFATLLKAGMPLVQSLALLRDQMTNPLFKSVLDDVHEKVRGGMALSDAFGDHGDLFPRVYTASLLAGERSGNLDAILRRYVAYEKVVDTVKRKTVSALMYPVILVVLALGLVGADRLEGHSGVQRFLRAEQRAAAAVHAGDPGRVEFHQQPDRAHRRGGGHHRRRRSPPGSGSRASARGLTMPCSPFRGLARPSASSPRRRWRARCPRCWAAVFRW